jgi:hypothetical protein
MNDLERELSHLREIAHAIRHPRCVPEIYGMLVGQTVPDLREHGQPADPRVEDAYGPWVAHCAALYLLDGDYTTKDPYQWAES